MGNEFRVPARTWAEQVRKEVAMKELQRQRDKELFAALDQRTKVPHLLIELRNLGYVEICGKDTGGIYSRLDTWLRENWQCEPVTDEARDDLNRGWSQCCNFEPEVADFCCAIPFSDYIFCGCTLCACHCPCCGTTGTISLMEQQPLRDIDRLCDANYTVGTPPTGSCCSTLAILECDRHYPLLSWYASRFCCASCVPKPRVFRRRGFGGESNMGKLTMQIVNFMTNECGWSLTLCNGTNLGYYGEIREQQIKFAAPHPLNLVAPHIMIELRAVGYIELNGLNTDGIHEKIGDWLAKTWKAQRIKADPDFCDVKFQCPAFKRRGMEGENNIGLRTMEIVDFMVKACAWTLITCNGGNFGRRGDLREQQLVFRNDAHVQHGEDHVMVELRDVRSFSSTGYIEVNGIGSSPDIAEPLDNFIRNQWKCTDYRPAFGRKETAYCDRKYRTPEKFYYRTPNLTNNLGKRTIELANFMASQGWLLMLCNGGAITEMHSRANRMRSRSISFPVGSEFEGQINREQQIKFTKARNGESHDEPLLMIELRAVPKPPDVENVPWCVGGRWESDFRGGKHERDRAWSYQTAERRKTRREEISTWLRADYITRQENTSKGNMDKESCTYPPYQEPRWKVDGRSRQLPCAIFQGLIEVNGPDVNGVYGKISNFVMNQMRGHRANFQCDGNYRQYCDMLLTCDVFRMKRVPFPHTNPEYDGYYLGENNMGMYTMRLCDFLVDHLGEWDLIVCNGNTLERAWKVDRDRMVSIAAREQQLIFRHRKVRRNVFMSSALQSSALGRAPLHAPEYWRPQSCEGKAVQELVPASLDELRWLQLLLDDTFKRTATRDRKADMANRFVVVSALRSEHPALWDRYAIRRDAVAAFYHERAEQRERFGRDVTTPRTMAAARELAKHGGINLDDNPSNEAFLFHGTNPTSALAILGSSFKLDFAGGAAGTMFGPGVYLAESSSKSDEYAQDDSEGAYKGLFAMLVCRAVVGRPWVTSKPGDYTEKATSGEYDSVLGDRERAVGTYREFIFFHEASVYPEYVIFYKRDYSEEAEAQRIAAREVPASGADPCATASSPPPTHAASGSATLVATVLGAPTGAPTGVDVATSSVASSHRAAPSTDAAAAPVQQTMDR